LGRGAQHRVTEKTDRLDAHETSWTHDGEGPSESSFSVRVYPSGNLGRVELDAHGGAVLARAPGGLRRVQRPGQGQAVGAGNPDQGAFGGLGIWSRGVRPGRSADIRRDR